MHKAWLREGPEWLRRRSFYAFHSIDGDACPPPLPKKDRQGFVMYLSSDWGYTNKGLDKFLELAKRSGAAGKSNRTFVVYGPNIPYVSDTEYEYLPNLKVPGDIAGQKRDDAYRNAIAYVMLTNIPEAFGRVTLEAMCMVGGVFGFVFVVCGLWFVVFGFCCCFGSHSAPFSATATA
jgi:glycosyltransferase involved in cell wall biosynthesis